MKLNKYKLVLATPLLLGSAMAYAHGPDGHTEEAKPLDCSVMQKMEHADTDTKDPVMMAMMKKCEGQMAAAHGDTTAEGHDHGGTSTDAVVGKAAEAQHSHGDAEKEHSGH